MSNYYVSSVGSDADSGLSSASAWETLSKVNSTTLSAGDIVSLRSGDTFNGTLSITDSGNSANWITINSYNAGNDPKVVATANGSCVDISASYIKVDGLYLSGGETGLLFRYGQSHVEVLNCEVEDVGLGILLSGTDGITHDNYVHDTRMIVNDPAPDSDYGAVGIWVRGRTHLIYNNHLENCIADSFDYGTDGGAFEYYGEIGDPTASGIEIYNNFIKNCDGVFENGANTSTVVLKELKIHHNIIHDIPNTCFSLRGPNASFGLKTVGMRIDNNTIIQDDVTASPGWTIIEYAGVASASALLVTNNIFYYKDMWRCYYLASGTIQHSYNLYYWELEDATIGLSLGTGEISLDNPDFIDVSAGDYRLESFSPAIDSGTSLGYSLDYLGNSIDASPDMGAYEFQGVDATASLLAGSVSLIKKIPSVSIDIDESISLPVGGVLTLGKVPTVSVGSDTSLEIPSGYISVNGKLPVISFIDGVSGAIELDAISTNNISPSSLTVNHVIGPGSDKLLLVGVAVEVDNPAISVTVGGNALTEAITARAGPNSCHIFYGLDDIITAGSNAVVVTSNDDITGTHITVASFKNADQSGPNDVQGTNAGGVTSLTHQLTTESGGVHFDVATHEREQRVLTFSPGQTEILNVSARGHTSNSAYDLYETGSISNKSVVATGTADNMAFVSTAFGPVSIVNINASVTVLTGAVVLSGSQVSIHPETFETVTIPLGSVDVQGNVFGVNTGAEASTSIPVKTITLQGYILDVTAFVTEMPAEVVSLRAGGVRVLGNQFGVTYEGGWNPNRDIPISGWTYLVDAGDD